MLQHSLESVLILYILLGTGFFISSKKWFQGSTTFLSDLLTKVILPANVFLTIYSNLDSSEELISLLPISFFGAVAMLLNLLVSWLIAGFLRLPRSRKGVFICSATFPNVILLGWPITEMLFGQGVMKYAMGYLFANTLLFWTLCNYILMYYGANSEKKFTLVQNLKKMFSPSLFMILVALAFVILGINIPPVINTCLSKISQSSTCLSMFFIGALIRRSHFGNILLSKDLIFVLILKLIISPAMMLLTLSLLPIPLGAKQTIFTITAMPVCVNFSIVSHHYKCDADYAAVTSAMMNILCIAALPLYMLILSRFWG